MKKYSKIFYIISFIVLSFNLNIVKGYSQGVAINNSGIEADPSAMLDVSSTEKGVLVTRMTTVQRDAISSPAQGLLIYNTTTQCFEFFENISWYSLGCTCTVPDIPIATAGSGATATQITANWNSATGATSYSIDVSTVSDFSSFVAGYNDLDLGAVTTYDVTGLTCETTYYYRIRAVNSCGTTGNSNIITAASGSCFTDIWTQKADFGGTIRNTAVGFSIGTKGYIGTGYDGARRNDFWEYDQTTDTWTQKSDCGGAIRDGSVGFSIGTKGYIGTGFNPAMKDFWEWDQSSNIWTQKTDFGGTARWRAIGFSIGTKGYIGTGQDGVYKKDFWEWNQSTNTWTQKADFGGAARYSATGFSIGTKGYVGTGYNGVALKDFWEWDQATNIWTQKNDFGGAARYSATGFSIGTKGFLGTGYGATPTKDFWEWDQSTDTWTQKLDFGGTARWAAVSFSIGSKGYVGTGIDATFTNTKDLWEYCP